MAKPTHKTYYLFLKSINPVSGVWPYKEEDWEEAKAWRDQGVDLSTAVGHPLKTTLFHRLAKLAYKAQNLTPHQAVAPFHHLARLTDGRALDPSFTDAWGALSTSYSSITADPVFHEELFKAFMYAREPQHGVDGYPGWSPWMQMSRTAIILDRPDLLDQLLVLAPKSLPVLKDIYFGGPRMLGWLEQHYSQELESNEPLTADTGVGGIGLRDYINRNGESFEMARALQTWWKAKSLDMALPSAQPSPSRKIRF